MKSIKAAGHARLFPTLKKGGNNYGDAVGKFFSRLVRKVGLTDPAFIHDHFFRLYVVIFQITLTLVSVIVSVLKPGKSKSMLPKVGSLPVESSFR